MSIERTTSVIAAALVAGALLSGCGSGGSEQLTQTLNTPTGPPQIATVAEIPGQPVTSIGVSATELYSRIATGAMSCWFAVGGPLKKDFIYHATADAASRGGRAEIVVHQRDPTQPNPRGPKSYVVDIEPTGETSAAMRMENLKMTEAFAKEMSDDVGRWAKGEPGCVGQATAVGWAPQLPAASQPTAAKPKSKKTKVKAADAKPVPKSQ